MDKVNLELRAGDDDLVLKVEGKFIGESRQKNLANNWEPVIEHDSYSASKQFIKHICGQGMCNLVDTPSGISAKMEEFAKDHGLTHYKILYEVVVHGN